MHHLEVGADQGWLMHVSKRVYPWNQITLLRGQRWVVQGWVWGLDRESDFVGERGLEFGEREVPDAGDHEHADEDEEAADEAHGEPRMFAQEGQGGHESVT